MDSSGDQGKKRKFSASSGDSKAASSNGGKASPFKKGKPVFNKNSKPPANRGKPANNGEGKKAKKALPKKKKKKTSSEKKVDRTRDFAGDLDDYLELWEERESEGSSWKFNKILQAWALDNCFNKKKVDSALFKRLIPYLLTVQGGAMDRLTSRAAAILSTDKSDIVDDDKEETVTLAEEGNDEDKVDSPASDDEEGAKKKTEVITKSMASRAKKIQKALNA